MIDVHELEEIVSQIMLGDINTSTAHIAVNGYDDDVLTIQVRSVDRDGRWQNGAKHLVSAHACRSEIVMKCLKAWLEWLEHEGRETFFYRDGLVGNPHWDVDDLVDNPPRTQVRSQNESEVLKLPEPTEAQRVFVEEILSSGHGVVRSMMKKTGRVDS